MLLVVDAMNVIGSRPDGWWRDRAAAVRRLHARLAALHAAEGVPILLVVDGRPLDDLPEGGTTAGVEVRYAPTRGPNAADDRIVALLTERAPVEAEVVTADRGLRDRLAALHVLPVGPGVLLSRLDELAPEDPPTPPVVPDRGGVKGVPRLRSGQRVGVVAPASPTDDEGLVQRGIGVLRRMGLTVEVLHDPARRHGFLAGSDRQRAGDLVAALTRDDLDGIVCLRGGDGTLRTLLALDRDQLAALRAARPKAVVGFSDITLLHAFLARELGWTSFYGPGLTSLGAATPYTVGAFTQALVRAEPFDVRPGPGMPPPTALAPGRAEGPLTGGCLSLVVTLIGTPWELDLRGRIFFFEDLNEAPYRIDRMLTQLLAAGHLQQAAGVVVGEHVNCETRDPARSLTLDQVLRELLSPLGVPVLHGLPLGHGRHLATVPLGCRTRLDADAGTLRILSPGVR